MKNKTVIIAAGGTGGHVFPGLALAEVLMARGYSVIWVGTKKGIEYTLVPKASIELFLVDVEGLRGRGLRGLIMGPLKTALATKSIVTLIRSTKPVFVFGLGGYVASAAGIASWLVRKPLFIHEQNAIAGTTNKFLSKLSTKIFSAFPGVLENAKWVGNPVRESIAELSFDEAKYKRENLVVNLLVLGGSRGAQAINETCA